MFDFTACHFLASLKQQHQIALLRAVIENEGNISGPVDCDGGEAPRDFAHDFDAVLVQSAGRCDDDGQHHGDERTKHPGILQPPAEEWSAMRTMKQQCLMNDIT